MKILSFMSCSLCLLAMESNAFSGSITTRNTQDNLLSGVRLRTIPRISSNSVIIPQTRSGTHTQHPLFGTSSRIPRVERTSLKTRLQMVFIILYRRVSQLLAHRRIRLPLAVLMTTWMLQFGGMVGVSQPVHAAASRTTTVSSRPATKTSIADKSDADATSRWDRHKRRAVIALGFGASLYSVKTYRTPTKSDDDEDEDATPINGSNNAPALKAVEPTTVDKKLELDDIVLESSATAKKTSADLAAPSTSALNNIDKKDKEDDNPITKFLDAVGANPEVVYGFLGSTLSFIVSEDLLISGITFAWIFKLFKESEAPKFTDSELKDAEEEMIAEIEQVETTVTDPEPVASAKDDDSSSEVSVEEYRPEEIMAEVPTAPDEQESLAEEIVAITEEAIEEPQASTVEEEVIEEIIQEPQASAVEEVVVEEIVPEPQASTVEEVAVEEIAPEPEASSVEEAVVEETVPEETAEHVVPEEEQQQQSPSTLNGEMAHSGDTKGKVETSGEQSKVPMSLADRAYKVVMDLGLIEWERKRRDKQL